MSESRLFQYISGKKVIYITVKNSDYIRTSQFERILSKHSSEYYILASNKGNPITRALDLRKKIPHLPLEQYDVIIAGFLPQLIWTPIIKNIGQNQDNSKILIADFFLSLYDTVVLDRKYIKPSNPIAKILKIIDRKVLDCADLIVTDTKADAQFFCQEIGGEQNNFETLYLEADTTLYNANIPATSHDSRNVLYFGTGLPLQGTDIVLKTYIELSKSSVTPPTLIFIGKADKKLAAEAASYENIRIISWLPQEELAKAIASADLCLAGHFAAGDGKQNRTIPGKAYIYEAMHKTMILGDSEANHELFKADSMHTFVHRGDFNVLTVAILGFLHK